MSKEFDIDDFMFGLGFGYDLSCGENGRDSFDYDPEVDDVLEISAADRADLIEDLVEMTANMEAGVSSASTEFEKVRFSDSIMDRRKPFEVFVDHYIQDLNDGRR